MRQLRAATTWPNVAPAKRRRKRCARRSARPEKPTASWAKIDAKLEKSRERGDHLRERIADLRAELARFEADAEKDGRLETRRLDDERTDAAARARSAERDADKARKALE